MHTKVCAINDVVKARIYSFRTKHTEFVDTGTADTLIILEKTVETFTYLGRATNLATIKLHNPHTRLVLFSAGRQTILVEGLADEQNLKILKLNDSLVQVTPPADPDEWMSMPPDDLYLP